MRTSESKICKILTGIICLLFFSLILHAQTDDEKKTAETGAAISVADAAENLIHIGDLIDVDVVGSTEYDWRGTLSPEGFLDGMNFVEEPIFGLCRTEEAVAADVAKGYAKILRNPQVDVKIIDRSRRAVSLLYGAVKTPQRFQIKRPVKLNELLILSGGLTDRASGEIQILRSPVLSCAAKKNTSDKQESGSEYINIKIGDLLKGQPESNPPILSGDVVTVFESKPIYVTGGVRNPKQIDARSELNVTRAVAAAGGLTKDADPKKITVFRVENKETKVIEIDFEKIETGEADDLILQPFDIVEVAQKGKGKSRYSPIPKGSDDNSANSRNLPLRIID